mmetsp:Transcript_15487/g.60559  ORF Transcript_15487/g.60559 Transcript_15487/m.60559 type:complete len:225 (+) Transcript_15487:677-1351(+)
MHPLRLRLPRVRRRHRRSQGTWLHQALQRRSEGDQAHANDGHGGAGGLRGSIYAGGADVPAPAGVVPARGPPRPPDAAGRPRPRHGITGVSRPEHSGRPGAADCGGQGGPDDAGALQGGAARCQLALHRPPAHCRPRSHAPLRIHARHLPRAPARAAEQDQQLLRQVVARREQAVPAATQSRRAPVGWQRGGGRGRPPPAAERGLAGWRRRRGGGLSLLCAGAA